MSQKFRERVSGVILREKTLLLLNERGRDFFWTPGGGVDEGETKEAALTREIAEELGTEVSKITPYISYHGESFREKAAQDVSCYIVEISGAITVDDQTVAEWFSKSDFQSGRVTVPTAIKNRLIPALVKDGLL